MSAPDGLEVVGASSGPVPAATIAARRVAEVRDNPVARLELLRSAYAPRPGAAPLHLRYQRAALAFMAWQLRRGLLNPLEHDRPRSPWWRAINERLLRDTCEARSRILGHPGPGSSPSVRASVRFASRPSPRSWYLAHNITIVSAYLEHAIWPRPRIASNASSSTSSSSACSSPTRSWRRHGSRCPGWHRRPAGSVTRGWT